MSKTSNSTGLSLGTILTIVFIVLKLTGYIDWSWWWVLSPMLISIGLSLVILVVIALLAVIAGKK